MGGIHHMLFGGGGTSASLQSNIYAGDLRTSGTSTAGVQFFSTGTYNTYGNDGGNSPPASPPAVWLTGGGSGANYEIKFTPTTGSPNAGDVTGSWLSLSTTRSWGMSRSTLGSISCFGTIEIRDAATLAVLASTNSGGVNLIAEIQA